MNKRLLRQIYLREAREMVVKSLSLLAGAGIVGMVLLFTIPKNQRHPYIYLALTAEVVLVWIHGYSSARLNSLKQQIKEEE